MWYCVIRALSHGAGHLLSSPCPEGDNPHLEVVQRLHFHHWSQGVEGQGDINTLVWHQRCVNGQGGAWDDSKAGQEKNRGDESSLALSKICPKYNVPFAKNHLPHLPTTPELPLLLLQGGNTAQVSRQSRQSRGNSLICWQIHHPASGNSSWNSPISHMALVCVLSTSLPCKEWPGLRARCSFSAPELHSTAGRVHHTLQGCCRGRGTWSQHRTNSQPRRNMWLGTALQNKWINTCSCLVLNDSTWPSCLAGGSFTGDVSQQCLLASSVQGTLNPTSTSAEHGEERKHLTFNTALLYYRPAAFQKQMEAQMFWCPLINAFL